MAIALATLLLLSACAGPPVKPTPTGDTATPSLRPAQRSREARTTHQPPRPVAPSLALSASPSESPSAGLPLAELLAMLATASGARADRREIAAEGETRTHHRRFTKCPERHPLGFWRVPQAQSVIPPSPESTQIGPRPSPSASAGPPASILATRAILGLVTLAFADLGGGGRQEAAERPAIANESL
jgi:hypothetical protein